MAQQLGTVVESATAPYQYALRTRAGCECIAHALQGLCDVDPNATIISIDGIGAFDQISRAAMLEGLMNVEGGGQAIPFVRSFYGSPSSYLWEDSSGITHTIPQGEGGEQGDPLMPLLFSLGQHAALQAIDSDLNDNEFLFAFLDDVYIVTTADRVGEVYKSLNKHLWDFSRIRINGGKTQVWNAIADRPDFCDTLERIARAQDPDARVWRGSEHGDKLIVHPPVLFQSIEIFVGGRGGRERGHVPGRGWRTRQHRALVAVNAELQEGERLMAFLDDVCVSTLPDRIADAHAAAGKHMHSKAGIVCTTGRPRSGIPKVRNQNVLIFLAKDAR